MKMKDIDMDIDEASDTGIPSSLWQLEKGRGQSMGNTHTQQDTHTHTHNKTHTHTHTHTPHKDLNILTKHINMCIQIIQHTEKVKRKKTKKT